MFENLEVVTGLGHYESHLVDRGLSHTVVIDRVNNFACAFTVSNGVNMASIHSKTLQQFCEVSYNNGVAIIKEGVY